MQAIGRWGNFFNQEAYGDPAPAWLVERMPGILREGMTINGTVMHPTFLYESVWNLLMFGVLYAVQRRKPPAGTVIKARTPTRPGDRAGLGHPSGHGGARGGHW